MTTNAPAALRSPKWSALHDFVDTWYNEPIGAPQVNSTDLDAVEHRIGATLPRTLREWYQFVGHRFRNINQDHAVRLKHLELRDGRVSVWWENQGNWSIQVPVGTDDDDPFVVVVGEIFSPRPPGRLSEALLGMLCADTIVGAWSNTGIGPIGSLKDSVFGEHAPCTRHFVNRTCTLPLLDFWPNPYGDNPPRGHKTLIVKEDGQWMAATKAARAEFAALLER